MFEDNLKLKEEINGCLKQNGELVDQNLNLKEQLEKCCYAQDSQERIISEYEKDI